MSHVWSAFNFLSKITIKRRALLTQGIHNTRNWKPKPKNILGMYIDMKQVTGRNGIKGPLPLFVIAFVQRLPRFVWLILMSVFLLNLCHYFVLSLAFNCRCAFFHKLWTCVCPVLGPLLTACYSSFSCFCRSLSSMFSFAYILYIQ